MTNRRRSHLLTLSRNTLATIDFRLQAGLACIALAVANDGIAASEVNWEAGITTAFQASDDDRVDSELTASADLFVTIPKSNGEWLIYFEASTVPDDDSISSLYPTANADAGSVLNRDGDGGVQISELNYTFFLDNSRTLMFGLIDPTAWLDRSRIANDENLHFLNGSFVNNATIEFPDYTLGGVFRWLGNDARPEFTVVVASSDGIADLPDRSYQDLLSLTANERAAFLGAGASWLHKRSSIRLGAWLRTGDHAVAGSPGEFERNYGMYAVLGWQDGSNALNFRVGLANEAVSVATQFAAIAYERDTPIGLLGIGVSRTALTNRFRRAPLENGTDAEIFLRIPIGESDGHLTPSIQFVENPGFDTSGATQSSSAVVASIRFHWAF